MSTTGFFYGPLCHAARTIRQACNWIKTLNATESSTPKPTDAATPPAPRPPGRPIARFVITFGILVAAFYIASASSVFRDRIFPEYLHVNARLTAGILSLFGQNAKAHGNMVQSSRFGMEVERGCDAIEPTILFLAAVLASPVAFRARLIGMVVGGMALAVMNVVRLLTLFLTGIYWQTAFEIMHVDVWQAIFIFLAILFWVLWALWALRPKPATHHDPA